MWLTEMLQILQCYEIPITRTIAEIVISTVKEGAIITSGESDRPCSTSKSGGSRPIKQHQARQKRLPTDKVRGNNEQVH